MKNFRSKSSVFNLYQGNIFPNLFHRKFLAYLQQIYEILRQLFAMFYAIIMLHCFNYISIFTFIISRFHDIHYIMHVKCNNYNYIKLLNIYLNISEERIKLSINFSKDYKITSF